MSVFINRLSKLIDETYVTQKRFLDDLGLSKNAINTWAKRNNIPKYSVLEKIADYFDVSIDYLTGKTDDPKRQPTSESDLTKAERKVLRVYREMEQSKDTKDVAMLNAVNKLLGLDE